MVEKAINNTDGYDLDEIITDIIISYELYNSKDIIDSEFIIHLLLHALED